MGVEPDESSSAHTPVPSIADSRAWNSARGVADLAGVNQLAQRPPIVSYENALFAATSNYLHPTTSLFFVYLTREYTLFSLSCVVARFIMPHRHQVKDGRNW